jgi:hypothetical protein
LLSDLRLVLRVEVHPGDQHNPKHGAAGLWSLLAQLRRERWPRLLRGDAEWGNEAVMARAEQEGLPYLFRLRATANVKRALERAMAERDWSDAGQGWQGKETTLRLLGWNRQRRVVLLRRQFNRPLALLDRSDPGQPLPLRGRVSFAPNGRPLFGRRPPCACDAAIRFGTDISTSPRKCLWKTISSFTRHYQ